MAYTGSKRVSWYQARGFYLLSTLDPTGCKAYSAAAVAIKKGDALHITTAPYATNATVAFASTFVGVAAEDFDNSAVTTAPRLPGVGSGAADITVADNLVLVIPPLQDYRWIVPVATTLITTAALGTIVDLDGSTAYKVLVSDVTGAANAVGFFVDDIDVSAAAIVGNTYGYAIGHFVAHTA